MEILENTEETVSEPGLGLLFIGSTDPINTLGVPIGTGKPSAHGGK